MLAYIIIRNAQYQHFTQSALDSQHTIIEQQTDEDIRIGQFLGWERLLYSAYNLPILGNSFDNPFAITIQFVKLKKFLHLVIIHLRVRVQHLLRSLSSPHIVAQIIEHHVAVEPLALSLQGILREAIVVIPRLHLIDDCFDVPIRRYHSFLLVIGEDFPYILRGEA